MNMHFVKRKQMWLCLATLLGAVAFMGCIPKNRGDVCDRETSDSFKIGDHAFAMDSDSIVQIGSVRWRVNDHHFALCLLTSVQTNSPEMDSAIQCLDSIYGEHDGERDEIYGSHLYWKNGLKLRPFHSEFGGTLLMIYHQDYKYPKKKKQISTQ